MSTPTVTDLATLRDALRDFAAARDWRQFHTPKNLAMAMIVEAAELVEHFQWATPFIEVALVVNNKLGHAAKTFAVEPLQGPKLFLHNYLGLSCFSIMLEGSNK